MDILLRTQVMEIKGKVSPQALKKILEILFKELSDRSSPVADQRTDVVTMKPVVVEPKSNSKGYTGILHLRCDYCGSVKTFCPTSPIDQFVCPNCNRRTLLKDLFRGEYLCSCGRKTYFKTNIEKESFDIRCGSCDSLITMYWDQIEGLYVNFSEEEKPCLKTE